MSELAPVLKQRYFDANGDPLAGGFIYSYAAGSSSPKATYTDATLTVPNANPVVLDADGYASVWLNTGTYKFVLADADDVVQFTVDEVKSVPQQVLDVIDLLNGGGSPVGNPVPDGGLEGDVLTKLSITDGDFDWKSYAYSGFSARFGSVFDSDNLDDTLSKILNLQYTGPGISLAASGNGSIREKGTAVTSSTLTATTTKRSNSIAQVRFYKGASLLNTVSSPNAGGGNEVYNWTGSFSDDTTFSAQVDDASGGGGPTTVTANASFTFVYPYYSDAGASGKSASQVAALTKSLITSTATVIKTMTATAGQVFYFAYPASYGALTSILDVNNFETIADWTLTTSNITGLDGNAVSYRIYAFNNPVTAGSYQYTFKR